MTETVAGKTPERVEKSDAEWRAELTPEAYTVTRRAGTERPFTHDDFPKAPGIFACVCCGQPLFDQAAKYDSGSGWPSFYEPLDEGAVEEREDRSLFMKRTEVVCARCSGTYFRTGPSRRACATA